MKTSTKSWIWFFVGVLFAPLILRALGWVANLRWYPYVVFGSTIVALPFVFIKMKRDSVPFRVRDLWGYAFLVLFCAVIGWVFWTSVR